MNLLKRLRNLWAWSEINPYSILTDEQKLENGFAVIASTKPKVMARIIKRSTPVEDFMEKNPNNE